MLHRFRDRFGTAGVVIAVIALVAALGGTALAASGALTAKQRKEVKAIAKSFQGTGPAGTNGTNGTNGKDGAPGAPGTNGAGVTTATASGAECPEGGVKLTTPNGTSKLCNGEEGAEGPPGPPGQNGTSGTDGSPWTAGGVLPPNATESGLWAAAGVGAPLGAGTALTAPISFNIPLSAAPAAQIISPPSAEEIENSEFPIPPAGCTGTVIAPGAEPGNLCIFVDQQAEVELVFGPLHPGYPGYIAGLDFGSGKEGALVVGLLKETSPPTTPMTISGAWAVTGE